MVDYNLLNNVKKILNEIKGKDNFYIFSENINVEKIDKIIKTINNINIYNFNNEKKELITNILKEIEYEYDKILSLDENLGQNLNKRKAECELHINKKLKFDLQY